MVKVVGKKPPSFKRRYWKGGGDCWGRHPDTLWAMSNLAATHRDQGQCKEAANLQEKALETRRRSLGEEHPDTLGSMANLTATLRFGGWGEKPSTSKKRVLETRRRLLGEEHPDTLWAMSNVAPTHRGKGRWEEAANLRECIGNEKVFARGRAS